MADTALNFRPTQTLSRPGLISPLWCLPQEWVLSIWDIAVTLVRFDFSVQHREQHTCAGMMLIIFGNNSNKMKFEFEEER